MKRYYTWLAGCLGLLLGWPATGLAAVPVSSGLSLSPAEQQIVLSGQANDQFSVTIFNRSTQATVVTLSAADFTGLNQTGGLAFLGLHASPTQAAHGLSSFLQFAEPTLSVPANSAKAVTVTIKNSDALAAGGHYAAILARPQAVSSGGGNSVALNEVLSSLVFVETAGQGTRSIKLLPVDMSKLSFGLPTTLDVVFEATGNTQVTPRGTVSVTHGSGPPQLRGIINPNSSLLLPGSSRLLSTDLHGNSHPLWPGFYQLQVQYHYDGALGVTNYQTRLLYINVGFLLVVIIGFGLAAGLLWRGRQRLVRRLWRFKLRRRP